MNKPTVQRTCIVTLEFSLVYDYVVFLNLKVSKSVILVDPICNLQPTIAFQSPIPHPLPL